MEKQGGKRKDIVSQPRQNQGERFHLSRFLAATGNADLFKIEQSERPDAYLHTLAGQDKVIGVEITELYRQGESGGDSLQAQEALRWRVVCDAKKQFFTACSMAIQVAVLFNDNYSFRKHDVSRLSGALVAIIHKNLPPEGCEYEEEYNWRNRTYFPIELSSVTVNRFADLGRYWRVLGATYVPNLDREHLQSVVDGKSQKADSYRKKCDELWLLLIADGFRLAAMSQVNPLVCTEINRRSFDRVFLLCGQEHLYELGVLETPKAVGDPMEQSLLNTPADDEPDDDDFDGGLTEARREAAAGKLLSHEEVKRELGLLN